MKNLTSLLAVFFLVLGFGVTQVHAGQLGQTMGKEECTEIAQNAVDSQNIDVELGEDEEDSNSSGRSVD